MPYLASIALDDWTGRRRDELLCSRKPVLERASGGWRGITYTPADVRLLQMIRRDLGLTTSRKEHPDTDPHGDVAHVA